MIWLAMTSFCHCVGTADKNDKKPKRLIENEGAGRRRQRHLQINQISAEISALLMATRDHLF
jgi:hypothetical protein